MRKFSGGLQFKGWLCRKSLGVEKGDCRGQFNFVWMFAIIVGGSILFFAIYGAMNWGDLIRYRGESEVAKSISILVDPLQAGFADGSFGKIIFGDETKIRNLCFEEGFGRNEISVSTKSDIGESWGDGGIATSIKSKYIFSREENIGTEFFVFSKSFDFPYEVSDMLFLTSEKYCFFDAPEDVKEDVSFLRIANIEIDENCTFEDAVKVCFSSGGDCDVRVYGDLESGSVDKDGDEMNYVGNLLYAAIFSEKEIYECNIQRLLFRTGEIAGVFAEKVDYMDARGCNSNLKSDLLQFKEAVSGGISASVINSAEQLDRRNRRELCGVW